MAAALVLLAIPDPAVKDKVGRALALLSYVAADYPAAVGSAGEVLSREEHDEQLAFVREAAQELRATGGADLAAELEALAARIQAREPPPGIVPAARRMGGRIAQRYQLAVLPPRAPDPRRGESLYRQACAPCHGAGGNPPPREKLELPTKPSAFASKDEMRRMSPQRIFSSATYGVPGTAMPAFGEAIDEAGRWDLAWYALSLAHADPREVARGRELLRHAPRTPDYLELSIRTDEQLRAALGTSGLSAEDREAVLSAVRSPPATAPR